MIGSFNFSPRAATPSLPQNIAVTDAPTFAGVTLTAPVKSPIQYATPLTLGTVNAATTTEHLILEPAGTIAVLTVNFPATPADGQLFTVSCAAIVTALTLAASGKTLVGALTAFAANGFAKYVYRASNSTWYRCG